jgi:hypothetical protein
MRCETLELVDRLVLELEIRVRHGHSVRLAARRV